MQEKKTVKIGSIYLFATLFNRGISFLTVPLFTRLLSTTDYGIVTTYISWVTMIAMIIGCSLHMGIRAAFIDFADRIKKVTSTVVTFTVLIFSGITILVCGAIILLRIDVNLTLVFMCLVQGLCSALITDYSMYLMMQYRYKMRTLLLIGPNLLSSIVSVVVILFVMETDLYMGRVASYCASYVLFGLLVLILCYRESGPKIDRELLNYTLKISMPLVPHGIALDILSQSDRMMLTWLTDASQTGIYSLVYNFSMISAVITSALEGIWIPWFTAKMKELNYLEINLMGRHYIHLMTYLMAGLIMISPELLKLFAPEEYWEGLTIVPVIIIANYLIFLYTMYVNVEHFYKKTGQISMNTCVVAVINVTLNLLLIPYFGYVAAAYTTLFSYLVSLLLHMIYSKNLNANLFPAKLFMEPLLHIVICIVLFYCLLNYEILRWVMAFSYAGLMFVRERKNIGSLFPEVANKFAFFR